MSDRPIDLTRVRAALKRLDEVVRDNPELTEPHTRERLADFLRVADDIDRVAVSSEEGRQDRPASRTVTSIREEAEPAGASTPNGLLSRNPNRIGARPMSTKQDPKESAKNPAVSAELLPTTSDDASATETGKPLAALDWTNPEQAKDWLAGIEDHVDNILAIAEDALRPAGERELGPKLARDNLADVKACLLRALAIGKRGLP